jgi:hypothetical protein
MTTMDNFPFRFKHPLAMDNRLENLKIVNFSEAIKEYDMRPEDIGLLARLICEMHGVTIIETNMDAEIPTVELETNNYGEKQG